MCFNSSSSSSSSSSSDVFDERVGADNGAVAFRELNGGSFHFDDTSQDVSLGAIDAIRQTSTDALTASTDFISQAFSQVITASEKGLERADQNLASTREFAASLIDEEQESSDDRLLQIIKFGTLAAIGVVAIQSGAIKDVTGAFK